MTTCSDIGTMYVVAGNGGGVQRGEGLSSSDFTAKIAPQQVGTLKVEVVPDTGEGTKRLVLSEYNALTGAAIEEGIVIERTRPRAAGPADPPAPIAKPDAVKGLLPATGGPAGIGAAGLTLAGRRRSRGARLAPDH